MKVEMRDARPALISGSGTPMTGKSPSAMPMLIKIWRDMLPTRIIMRSIPCRSGERRDALINLERKTKYARISPIAPTKPVCSEVTAKMKSEWGSGRNLRVL
jgi:hypothetical protein